MFCVSYTLFIFHCAVCFTCIDFSLRVSGFSIPVPWCFEEHTHTNTITGHFSGTTQASRYQKGKTNLDFTEATDSEWHWHQLGRIQVCTLLQTDNHASTPTLCFYRSDALPVAREQRHSIVF